MENENENSSGGISTATNGNGTVDLSQVKRGRGRPPGSKNKTPTSDTAKSSAPFTPLSDADAEFISEAVVNLLECGDEILARTLEQKLSNAIPEKLPDFRQLRQSVGLNEKDKKVLRSSVTALVKKYGVLGRFGPEILLIVFLGQYSYRQLQLMKFVEGEVKAAKKEKPVEKVE
jgi:hypothetical protein